jgi:hypothetical protein
LPDLGAILSSLANNCLVLLVDPVLTFKTAFLIWSILRHSLKFQLSNCVRLLLTCHRINPTVGPTDTANLFVPPPFKMIPVIQVNLTPKQVLLLVCCDFALPGVHFLFYLVSYVGESNGGVLYCWWMLMDSIPSWIETNSMRRVHHVVLQKWELVVVGCLLAGGAKCLVYYPCCRFVCDA